MEIINLDIMWSTICHVWKESHMDTDLDFLVISLKILVKFDYIIQCIMDK